MSTDKEIDCNLEINESLCKNKKPNHQWNLLVFAIVIVCIVVVIMIIIGGINNWDIIKKVGEAVVQKSGVSANVESGNIWQNIFRMSTAMFLVMIVSYILLIYAIVIIIQSAYDIKNSYELGSNLEKQCNNVFMEKERADFQAYSCYNAENEYSDTADGVFSNTRGGVKQRLQKAYEELLVIIIILILISTIIAVFITFCIKWPGFVSTHLWFFLGGISIFVSLIILLSLWFNGNYNKDDPLLNPYKGILYDYDIKRLWNKENISNIVFNHVIYIILIFITVISGLYYINMFTDNDDIHLKIPNSTIWMIGIILIMLSIIIPLFIKSARAFELNISHTYVKAKDTLNNFLYTHNDEKNSSMWKRIRKELENNISAYNRSKSKNSEEQFEKIDLSNEDTYKEYKPSLYMYLTHIVNKDNIIGIPIPQQLKPIIKPEYLAGELSIELKEAFITTYHNYINNTEHPKITKETLNPGEEYNYLTQYLKEDVRIKIDGGNGNQELALLNNHILLSDNFKKGNPFPEDIIQQLIKMRKDTTIKKTVDEYFSLISLISSIILIFIAYYIYHVLVYPNDVDIKIQYVAMFLFVIMLILGFTGWWMKELWL